MEFTVTCLLLLFNVVLGCAQKPNIVLVIADDLGSFDLSYHGSNQFMTPNIDALGYNGVILNRHYTSAICTPSRAALLTGQYPIRLGMQGSPISAGEDRHLPIDVPTLPKFLKQYGYKTHLVGKWHLGAARRQNTPLGRGFDTHFGYWNGYVGYFSYKVNSTKINNETYRGFDLKTQFTDAWEHEGKYATDLFTEKSLEIIEKHDKKEPMFLMLAHLAVHTGDDEEVEVPDEKEMNEKFDYIKNLKRRRYADALTKIDDSVGRLVEKLQDKDMLNNTVIVFISDNGAPRVGFFKNEGSNYPLRGEKFSLHEGGIRNAAIIYSSLLEKKNYVHDKLLHITDWLPTFVKIAGGNITYNRNIDGVDQWESISKNASSQRDEILINIDEAVPYSAFTGFEGRYKLMNGTLSHGEFDHYGEKPEPQNPSRYDVSLIINSKVNKAIRKSNPGRQNGLNPNLVNKLRAESSNIINNQKCSNRSNRMNSEICTTFCLFDLWEDPCETENLIEKKSLASVVARLKLKLEGFWAQVTLQGNLPVDINSDPRKYNGTWCTWLDDAHCVKT